MAICLFCLGKKKKKDYIVNWRAQQSDPHSGIFNAYECN